MNFDVMLLSTVLNSPNKQVKVFGGNFRIAAAINPADQNVFIANQNN